MVSGGQWLSVVSESQRCEIVPLDGLDEWTMVGVSQRC
jgi:hypothetical protein